MALEEFSTLATLKLRANTKRIKGWADKDGDDTPDSDTLTAAFQYASGIIFEHLVQRYGETQLASWSISNCPARLLAISDDLCLHYLSSMNNVQNAFIRELYEDAIASLTAIRDYEVGLYGATEDMTDKYVVEEVDSEFEEIEYWNYGGYSARSTCCNRCAT